MMIAAHGASVPVASAHAQCRQFQARCFSLRSSTRSAWRTGSGSHLLQPRSSARFQQAFASRRPACLRVLAVDKTVDSDAGVEVEEQAMEKMDKSFEAVQRSFTTVRTGRASPSMLDRIQVDYYGAMSPLRTIAGISTPDAQSLVIQPYDVSAMPNIEKAILKSDLGVTPSNDGKVIRINIPPLTAERRKEMSKTVSKLSEDGKVAIRNVRRDAMKQVGKLKKDGDLSEDGAANLESTIDELTNDYVKQVEKLSKDKSEELTNI